MVECFNYHLQKMKENGIFNQLLLKSQAINRNFNTIDDGVTLTYENVIFPCLIIVGGIIISVCQWAMENIWFRVKGKFFTPRPPPNAPFKESTKPAWEQMGRSV